MDTFKYTAISQDGKRVNGVIEGFNEMDAVGRIKESYPIVVAISQENSEEESSSFLTADLGGNKLNDKAFTLMCSQFAVILKAGIPIARTVTLISQKMTDKPLKKILEQVAEDVEAGRSLSASFAARSARLVSSDFSRSCFCFSAVSFVFL
jgi:type IV pilus assembly protein PilC